MNGAPARRTSEIVLGAFALVLTLATIALSESNRLRQGEVAQRQQLIVKAQTLANVNNSLVQLLARSSAENKDQALTDLLARNGVSFTVSPDAASGAGGTLLQASNATGTAIP